MNRAGDIFERGLSRNRAGELRGQNGFAIALEHDATDAVDTGNSLKLGGRAVSTFGVAVADLDRTDWLCDQFGRPLRAPHCTPLELVHGRATAANSGGTGIIIPSSLGQRLYVTEIWLENDGNLCDFEFRNGAAGAVLVSGSLAVGVPFHASFPVPLRLDNGNELELFNGTAGGNPIHGAADGYYMPI